MQSDIGMDMGTISKMSMLEHYGKRDDFNYVTNAKLTAINPDSVTVERDGKSETLGGIDTVVMAVGSKPDSELKDALDKAGRRLSHRRRREQGRPDSPRRPRGL